MVRSQNRDRSYNFVVLTLITIRCGTASLDKKKHFKERYSCYEIEKMNVFPLEVYFLLILIEKFARK